jgi:hypothetical protein
MYCHAMSWFKRAARTLHHDHVRAEIVQALVEWEQKFMLDVSRLNSAIATQSTLIAQLQSRVASLEASQVSSADQGAVDAAASTVESNNAILATIAST